MQALYSFFIFLLFSMLACSNPSKEFKKNISSAEAKTKAPVLVPKIEKGKIVTPVYCVNDVSQSYAAYLPSYYDSSKKQAVLFAFDAHAAGRIPVETYKDLCEKYGYILVASNNSKNGMDANMLNAVVATFMKDVKLRLNIDEKRIYLCGFSGGARVAALVAMQGGVCGVACCSAGFQPTAAVPFNFIGFAGNEDFNSNEMIELNQHLDMTNTKHHLFLFDGKHEWPNAQNFENAFLWFEFNAMKDKLIAPNTTLINEYKSKQEAKIKALQAKNKLYEAYVEADRAGYMIFGLTDCSTLLSTRVALEKTALVKNTFIEKTKINKQERELQNYYRKAIQEKDYSWWRSEIDGLTAQAALKQNSKEAYLLIKRTLSFLSLLSYMASNSALTQNQFPEAEMYLKVYEKVDPDNSEVYYLQAVLAAKQQNKQGVLILLQKAVAAGFIDIERVEKEVYFTSVNKSEAFAKLMEQVKAKK